MKQPKFLNISSAFVAVSLVTLACFAQVTRSQKLTNDTLRMRSFRPTYSNEYVCVSHRVADNTTKYIRSFYPFFPNHNAHHVMLYGCETPGRTDVDTWQCGEMALPTGRTSSSPHGPVCGKGDEVILFAAAMGAGGYTMPDDVSFKSGEGSGRRYIVLQVHYKDVEKFKQDPSLTDASGVTISYQTERTKYLAGMFLLGSNGVLPPLQYTQTGISTLDVACGPKDIQRRQTLIPFAFRVHAHMHGVLTSGFRIKSEEWDHPWDPQWDLIGRMSPQLEQTYYKLEDPDMVIYPDDTLVSRCVYFNPSDKAVHIGAKDTDEMCNFYVLFYSPDGQDLNSFSRTTCFGDGSKKWEEMLEPMRVPQLATKLSLGLTPEEEEIVEEKMEERMSKFGL